MRKKHMHKFSVYIRMLLAVLFMFQTFPVSIAPVIAQEAITGCANNSTQKYNGYFDPGDFVFNDIIVGENNKGLHLNPNKGGIDPNSIVIDKKQGVWATFFYEDAGHVSDFGWMLYSDAVDDQGTEDKSDDVFKGWDTILKNHKAAVIAGKAPILHPVFVGIEAEDIEGDWEDEVGVKNGRPVFDKAYGDPDKRSGVFPVGENGNGAADEAKLADISLYDDGSGLPFDIHLDGKVTAQDMRKKLGEFEAGTELVFFLADNHRWYQEGKASSTFFTKTEWNPDNYIVSWQLKQNKSKCNLNDSDVCDYECLDRWQYVFENGSIKTEKTGNEYHPVLNDCFDDCKNDQNKNNCIKACYDLCPDTCFDDNMFYCKDFPDCEQAATWRTITRKSPYTDEISSDEDSAGWVNLPQSPTSYTYSESYSVETDNTKDNFGEIKEFKTKVKFNPDDTPVTFRKRFNLGVKKQGSGWQTSSGWLSQGVIDVMKDYHFVEMKATDFEVLNITNGQKYPHVIVGSPQNEPDQWILGWEDLTNNYEKYSDDDYEDLVFRIEIDAIGTAQLKQSKAMSPADEDTVYTGVTIKVADYQPCGENTDVEYYLATDGGVSEESWTKVRWDNVYKSDASGIKGSEIEIEEWKAHPEKYAYTYRTAYFDFAALGKNGRELVWKTELRSKNPDLVADDGTECVPQIIDVELIGDAARNSIFSRATPIVKTNVVYSGAYETPAYDWDATEQYMRGHLVATRTYDPANPKNENVDASSNVVTLWDAGAQLTAQDPADRNIYCPNISYTPVTDETLMTSNQGVLMGEVVSGSDNVSKLAHTVIQPGSLEISVWKADGNASVLAETFYDRHTDEMEGDNGGSGTVNRFTGEFSLKFVAKYPVDAVRAQYTYYTAAGLKEFTTANIDAAMLNLTDEYVYNSQGTKYVDDIDGDGFFDAASDASFLVNWVRGYKDNGTTKKAWLLGAVDHSSPAIVTAPGMASWYETLTDSQRASYDTFIKNNIGRRTLVLVGAQDGMLHAFDGGHFRWGADFDNLNSDNPDTPDITEYRGYFKWDGASDLANPSYTYGSGEELWAFIPANLISRFKVNFQKSDGARASVDASPAVADVYIDGSGWKTVVLSAQGNGGDTVFCLDITAPDTPKFMWEFTDPDLFRSKSSPAVAQVRQIKVGGVPTWVTFFVSGKPSSCVSGSTDKHCFPSIFIIDIGTGHVIERIFLDCEADGINGVPGGQPAIVDFDGNGYADRLYIGTDKGYLYRVNLPEDGGKITQCVVNQSLALENGSTSSSGRQPIYASPTVVTAPNLSVTLFYGTSDNPEITGDSADAYGFFAYEDTGGKGSCVDATLKWFIDLPAGQKVFASAFAAAGKIYFGTSTQDIEDPCSSGYIDEDGNEQFGKLYIVDMVDGPSNKDIIDTGNIRSSPVVDDNHVYLKTEGASLNNAGNLLSIGSTEYNNEMRSVEVTIPGGLSAVPRWWKEVISDD